MLEQLCARLGRESSAVRDRVTLVHGDIRCDDAGCRFPLIIALEGFETADFWGTFGQAPFGRGSRERIFRAVVP
ncbi:MAG: hypothetical protein NT090_02305 [Acidobacteria bacterium]|nr:hypothetical protein [Acidobacteriota bacterium]